MPAGEPAAPARRRKAAAAPADDPLDDLVGNLPSIAGALAMQLKSRWLAWAGIGVLLAGLLSRDVGKWSWARALAGLALNLSAVFVAILAEERKKAGGGDAAPAPA